MTDMFLNLEEALEAYYNMVWKLEELEMFPFLEEKDFEGIA